MGKVFLIGAGPGDPELMTLKAARALGVADVILIDELVSRGCLAHARSDARVIEVGKRGGCKSTPQAFIEKLLVLYSKEDKIVARLKGGDPFVFGRGAEELAALEAAGIEVEIIPGITAGIGVPAMLGIPRHAPRSGARRHLRHRAHERRRRAELAGARRGRHHAGVLHGAENLPKIVAGLLGAGMQADTPACVIEKGTLKTQRQSVTTLARLSAAGFEGPALVVVGEVVRFARAQKPRLEKAA